MKEQQKYNMESIQQQYDALIKITAEKNQKKIVVDAGLLKAGKSSLFNALVGKDIFATDVVRATIENQKEELEDYILLDTPGLDARQEDTDIAVAGYECANVILFVHNLQEGELSKTEVDSITEIAELFGDKEKFFKNAVLVLTHKDQVEERVTEIYQQIALQCQNIFQMQFAQVYCVDSVGYLKGLHEQKKLLMQDSNIEQLQEALRHFMNNEYDLQKIRIQKWKKECVTNIDYAITMIKAEMPSKVADRSTELKIVKNTIWRLAEEKIQSITKETMRLSSWHRDSFTYLGKAKDYKEYSSEYSARSAGIDAIENMITKAKRISKEYSMDVVKQVEKYILISGKPTEVRNTLSDIFEEIRKIVKTYDMILHTTFALEVHDFMDSSTSTKLSNIRNDAKYGAGFSSADYYASAYSSNLYIGYDYKTKWVKGLFGERKKWVTVYNYDAEGAMSDVSDDLAEFLNEIAKKAEEIVQPVFDETKKDLCSQFNALISNILKEIDQKIREEEQKQKTINDSILAAKKMINKLEAMKKDVINL